MSSLATAPPRVSSAVASSLQALLVAAFLYFGITKYVGGEAITTSFEEIGAGQWLRYATGTTEILGALALIYVPLSGLAAAALAAQMAGAAVTQVAFVENGSAVLPIVLGLLALVVAWLRRDQSVQMLRRFRLLPLSAAR